MSDGLKAEIGVTLNKLTRQLAQAESRMVRTTKKMESAFNKSSAASAASFRRIDSAISKTALNLGGLKGALVGALSVRQVQRYADAWTVANNKIAAASQVVGTQARSMAEINDIATATRSGITETADLYAKLLRATKGVAKSEMEVARATEIVNKAFKAGGAAASEQAAGILQLAQGLSSGVLQGDELRSIRENAPLVAQAIADEFGVTIGKLKELGSEGKLTSDKVFRAILNAQPEIEAAFAKTNSTIGEGFTLLANAVTEYIGAADNSIGATEKIGAALSALAKNIDTVVAAGGVLAGVTFGPALLRGLIAARGLIAGATVGLASLSAGARVTTLSIGALRGAIGILGGPIGLLITGLSLLPLAIETTGDRVESLSTAGVNAVNAMDAYASASSKAADEQGKLAGKVSQATTEILNQSRANLQDALRGLKEEYANVVGDITGEGVFNLDDISGVINELKTLQRVSADGGYGEILSKVATSLEGVKSGNGSLAETASLLQGIIGVSQEALGPIAAFDNALRNANPDWIDESRAKLRAYAEAAGVFSDQIATIDAAKTAKDAGAAWSNLRDRIYETLAVSDILSNHDALLQMVQSGGDAETKINAINAALTGTNDQIQAANDRLQGADDSAASLAATSHSIDFSGAAATAGALASQLQRAVAAAASLASQGVASNERARINYDFRDDPVGKAAATARATFDARVGDTSGADSTVANVIEGQRRAFIAAAVEAENYRQKLIAANKATRPSSGGGGGGGGGGSFSFTGSIFDVSDADIARLNAQISAIGQTKQQIVALTTKQKLLNEAKNRGLNLDQIQAQTGKTLAQEIDEQAAAVGRLAEKYSQAAEQQKFWQKEQAMMQDGLLDAVLSGESLNGVLADMAKALAKAALQAALFNSGPFSGGSGGGLFGGLFSGLFGGAGGGLFGGLFGSANGNVFAGGSHVQAYASGGVVNGPTLFPMTGSKTGLMGEAGPEAIMPLTRTRGGKLGVQAVGGGAVDVRVYVDENGNWKAAVEGVAGNVAAMVVGQNNEALMQAQRRG